MNTMLACLIAYLFGSISSAVIVCKWMGFSDPRTQGSKNPGATNVLRMGGKKAAFFTLTGDVLKGFIPVLVAKYSGLDFDTLDLSLVALSAFLGHLYPLFFKFKGGKGVATALGALLALSGPLGFALLFTWTLMAYLFRYSSLASLVMMLCAPCYAWWLIDGDSAVIISIMSILLISRHWQNMLKLIVGMESQIGKKK